LTWRGEVIAAHLLEFGIHDAVLERRVNVPHRPIPFQITQSRIAPDFGLGNQTVEPFDLGAMLEVGHQKSGIVLHGGRSGCGLHGRRRGARLRVLPWSGQPLQGLRGSLTAL
jgi:hypothetical protein